jgi:hypothetical protein
MRLKRTLCLGLLTLTFLVGQWLSFVHSTEHVLVSGDELVACEICVAQHAAAPPPSAELPLALLPVQAEQPAVRPTLRPLVDRFLLPPSRGPPSSLA